MTLEEIIDKAQERLHDDGVLWSRTELLEWANDGYRQMLAQSQAVIRPYQYDMPPRCTFAGTQEWEDISDGTFQRFTRPIRNYNTTFDWEVEQLEGVPSPENSYPAVTQLWETAYTDDTNRHFRFIVGKAHDRPIRVYWDDKQLTGTSDRELDLHDTRWWRESGEPIAWLKGDGRDQSFEIFEALTSYTQAYDLKDATQGIPRHFSGPTRTYGVSDALDTWDYAFTGGGDFDVPGLGRRITQEGSSYFYLFAWEADLGTDSAATVITQSWEANYAPLAQYYVPVGLARRILSDERQYLAAPYDDGGSFLQTGSPRDYKSSKDSVTLWEAIVPTRNLTEQDIPVLIPAQLHKYLKFYVLGKAFSRRGEGQKIDLAAAYINLFKLGLSIFTNLGNLTFIDRVYAREDANGGIKGRPPRVRLPATYPLLTY